MNEYLIKLNSVEDKKNIFYKKLAYIILEMYE